MKVPPKKPHFFKPILSGFKNGLKIPLGFLKYLKGLERVKCAVLKRAGKKWLVKVNGQKLEEGNWGRFVEEFDLQLGNILVFRHEGNMEFEVSIFDSTQCDREYPEYMQQDEVEDEYEAEEEEVEEDEDEYVPEEEEEDEDEYVAEEEEEDEDEYVAEEEEEEDEDEYVAEEEEEEDEDEYEVEEEEEEEEVSTHDEPCEKSYFECTITQYCLSFRCSLFLPQQFALANGLTKKKCRLIVRGERQKSWKLKICHSSNPRARAYMGSGWHKFVADNCIKEGDRIMFEVVTNGKTPIWKFQVVTDGETPVRRFQEIPSPNIDLPNEASSHAEAATNEPFVRPHFEYTIRQKILSRCLLYVPQQFAIANGLTNKKCWLIVRDERQRSWNLKLSFGGTKVKSYIGHGLRKFFAENCIKEGDRIKFEVVTNGKTPIWKFQVARGEIPMKKFQETLSPSIKLSNKTSSHAEAATNKPLVQSHFECTIREYCLSRGLLYLPKQFAFANCLIDKKCDLIIRDERQRSWNLKLCYCHTDVYIGDGWRKFVADNCLKEGDRLMFEVVTNGETPIWKFLVSDTKTPLQKYQDIMKNPSNTSPLSAQVSTSTSGDDDYPYFISTIKPYCIRKTELYLPLDFAKSNGLMNRKCEMVLKDETDRCWSVWLGGLGTNFGITRGWAKFRAEKGLQAGDAYKFGLIKNGEIPIAHFHCKYSAKDAKRKKQ